MRNNWQLFLQSYLEYNFQLDRVVQLFMRDQIFSMDETEEISAERTEEAKRRKFYAILLRRDEDKLDKFAGYLREVKNFDLAEELERGICQERARLAALTPLMRSRSGTLGSTVSMPPGTPFLTGSSNNSDSNRSTPTLRHPNNKNNENNGENRHSYHSEVQLPSQQHFTFDEKQCNEEIRNKALQQQQWQIEMLATKHNSQCVSPIPQSQTDQGKLAVPTTPGSHVATLFSNLEAQQATEQRRMSALPLLQVGNIAAKQQDNVTDAGRIPSNHEALLRDLLLNSSDAAKSQEKPATQERIHHTDTRKKMWSINTGQQLRQQLFKAIEQHRYCDQQAMKEPLCDCIENWLASSSDLTLSVDNSNKSCKLLTLLFIGPAGTGKHKVLKSIAADVLHRDMFNNAKELIDKYSSSPMNVSSSSKRVNNDIAILCSDGFRYDSTIFTNSGNSPGSSPTDTTAALLNADVKKQCYNYVQRFKKENENLLSHFSDECQERRHPSHRLAALLHVVIQDIDGFFDMTDKKSLANATNRLRRRSSSSSTALLMSSSQNETSLRSFRPHPKQLFTAEHFNVFSENGIIVFAPIALREDELQIIARDLNAASAYLEEQSFKYLQDLVGRFVDSMLSQLTITDSASGSPSSSLSPVSPDRRAKLIHHLLGTIWSRNHGISGNTGEPGALLTRGHRLKVEFFKNYHLSMDYGNGYGHSRRNNNRSKGSSVFLRLFGCASQVKSTNASRATSTSSGELLDEDDDNCDDVEMLEELRRLVKSKGPLSRKCYQTLLDLLSELLIENAERFQTCDFVVKLQLIALGKQRNHGRANDSRRFQFGLVDARQQGWHGASNDGVLLSFLTPRDDVTRRYSNDSLSFMKLLNRAPAPSENYSANK